MEIMMLLSTEVWLFQLELCEVSYRLNVNNNFDIELQTYSYKFYDFETNSENYLRFMKKSST